MIAGSPLIRQGLSLKCINKVGKLPEESFSPLVAPTMVYIKSIKGNVKSLSPTPYVASIVIMELDQNPFSFLPALLIKRVHNLQEKESWESDEHNIYVHKRVLIKTQK